MHGYLWPEEVRDRWWLRTPAAIAAGAMLLLAGFVVGALWAALGVWPTNHVLVPLANDVFGIAYIGILLKAMLIIASIITRFGVAILVVLLVYPFLGNAKWRTYFISFIAFMFYGWFFATMYIIYH